MERTFVAIKPDAVQRGLVGEILARYEKKGIKIAAAKFFVPSTELAEKHYAEHSGKYSLIIYIPNIFIFEYTIYNMYSYIIINFI